MRVTRHPKQRKNPTQFCTAIRKLIENHPLNWEQGVWYGFTSMSSTVDSIRRDLEEGTCGTTACVAGWAAILVSPGEEVVNTLTSIENGFDLI